MPFGPFKDFAECVEKNSDKSSPEAYCAYLHKQITGEWPGKHLSNMPDGARDLYMTVYSEVLLAKKAEKESHELALQAIEAQGWQRGAADRCVRRHPGI